MGIAHRKRGSVDLGIRRERVSPGDHIAFIWETQDEFAEATGFLDAAIAGKEHAVIFGHPDANDRVCEVLRARGHDLDSLQREGRLTILGGAPKGDTMLEVIGSTFQSAMSTGATFIRLLGNIGWHHENWPAEKDILEFEAKVTTAAKAFPCVVLCLYDVQSLSSEIIEEGAYRTHPLTICRNVLRENPLHVPIEDLLSDRI